MNKTTSDGSRIMREHGVYPLLDTFANDALLLTTICHDGIPNTVSLYVDAKGFHLIWQQVKTDKNGDAIWNGSGLLMETKNKDIDAELAAKFDYAVEAPDFTTTPKDEAKNDETWFITDPDVSDGYMFTLCGLRDDKGAHISHVFATDGSHSRLLLAPADLEQQTASLEHMGVAMVINGLSYDDTTRLDTDVDILSKAKELLK